MTRRPLIAIALALGAAGPAGAEAWALRDGDRRLEAEALRERLDGSVLTFHDDGRSEYYTDGRYTYTYADEGGTAYGYWRIAPDGVVCIEFVHGAARCDLYVMDGARLVLLNERGARFPVRP